MLKKFATKSARLAELYEQVSSSLDSVPPYGLGYPSKTTQSSYYPGNGITEEDIAKVSGILEKHSIFPENTRIRKADNGTDFEVLLASTGRGTALELTLPEDGRSVSLVHGDHSEDLQRICAELSQACKFAANDFQRGFLEAYIQSFQTGSLDKYRDSLRYWIKDKGPRVENIFGFVEPYRDPYGIRAEFEGMVAIADVDETKLLAKVVDNSAKFIRRLPWASPENDGKGPFEKNLFEPPDFSSIHCEWNASNDMESSTLGGLTFS